MTLANYFKKVTGPVELPKLFKCSKCGYPCFCLDKRLMKTDTFCCLHYMKDITEGQQCESLKFCNSCKNRYKAINFSYYYDKLYNSEFTTIRGITWFTKYSVGDVVPINILRRRKLFAMITKIEKKEIADIPIAFIQKDTNYGKHGCNDHHDFIKLINDMPTRKKFKKFVVIDSEMTILSLRRVVIV